MTRRPSQASADLASAARSILADVDAPGHTIRNIRWQNVALLRDALAEWDANPTDPANLARSQRREVAP